jgi:hypothetical protein
VRARREAGKAALLAVLLGDAPAAPPSLAAVRAREALVAAREALAAAGLPAAGASGDDDDDGDGADADGGDSSPPLPFDGPRYGGGARLLLEAGDGSAAAAAAFASDLGRTAAGLAVEIAAGALSRLGVTPPARARGAAEAPPAAAGPPPRPRDLAAAVSSLASPLERSLGDNDAPAMLRAAGDNWGPLAPLAACAAAADPCLVHASARGCVEDELCGWCPALAAPLDEGGASAAGGACLSRLAAAHWREPAGGARAPRCAGPLAVVALSLPRRYAAAAAAGGASSRDRF